MLRMDKKSQLTVANLLLRVFPLNRGGVLVARGSRIRCRLQIGQGTRINGPLLAKGRGLLEIGKYCAFGEHIRIITSNHDMGYANIQYHLQKRISRKAHVAERRGVTIGNSVWIGDSAIILPGVSIGDGAVIGAGAVVSRSVPAFSLAAGNPVRVIRRRFPDEVIEILTEIRWWDWPMERIVAHRALFEAPLEGISREELLGLVRNPASGS